MARKAANASLWRYWPRLLLLIPFALVAWVPFYNRIEPALGGIPFFYWYQLAAILAGAAVVVGVYVLEGRKAFADDKRGRKASGKDRAGRGPGAAR
ncbi:DUF3311 domain-containing protein [Methyloceanibacter sp.]|uniref:DUF3311 domain-containing protein n=1 Tax=Methyloceanibacter sp. TaxID=1965321 RepID=UPI00208D53C9|nr:DUF3311 domain-containing protein [Methyloceanibacter sp.]GFO83320.1 MAG: hypothetical protein A49_29470 [Methyloceanibacter sp.]HML93441.1 DUF3311 domain-containing protein [Methyloceanibacter sp.]